MQTLICQLIILFFVFSIVGWMIEVTLKYFQYHRFINRGFMIGPYCPIYGSGVVAITVCVGGLVGSEGSIGDTFLAGFFICGALEYITSWYMEKLFHARWWDYSQKPMNLNGRVWIGNLLLFGIASVAVVRIVPNAELGHLQWNGDSIEKYAATSARERENLSWEEWAGRLQEFYTHLEFLFSPDLILVGGGVSKNPEKFLPLIKTRADLRVATHANNAGIIGAASLAL